MKQQLLATGIATAGSEPDSSIWPPHLLDVAAFNLASGASPT